ncbi:MAG: alpha/beta hydrolase [Candidatus Limnocylindrales bacterium]|jgi:pimeloyl-ACP methyl ester carboxylesterase
MERFVEVPGGRLFAVSEGSGPPIVLMHAAIVDLRAWDAMVPGLVAAGFRVVRYDYRAFGASTTEDVEFSNRADLRAVMDAFGIGRAALVGNSRGGIIAIDAAIEFPERVVAVVGLGAGLGGFEGELTPEELAIIEKAERLESAAEPDVEAIVDLEVPFWVNGPGQPPDRVDPAIREAVRAMDRPLYEAGRVKGRSIKLDPPANERLGDLSCPVLAVAGALDLSEIVQTARHLEAAAPNARAVIWPDVAHMIGMEAPDRLNALIVEFLAPLRPWR